MWVQYVYSDIIHHDPNIETMQASSDDADINTPYHIHKHLLIFQKNKKEIMIHGMEWRNLKNAKTQGNGS